MASMTNPTMKNRVDDKAAQLGQYASEAADRAKDTASSVADKAKDTACSVADKAKDAVSNFSDKAKDAVSNLGDKAKDAACTVAHKAEDAASYVSHQAENAAGSVGSGLESLGHAIREKSPHGGMMGDASSAVADTLEHTGRYLQEEGFKGISDDVTNMIRRNPIPALLAGIGIGFLIARATTSRS